MKKSAFNLVKMLGVVALATSMVSVWPGCKGNGPSTYDQPHDADPLVMHALNATGQPGAAGTAVIDAVAADPMTSPIWQTAHWGIFTPAIGDARTPQPTRAACLFDANYLYVAFVCVDNKMGTVADETRAAGGPLWERDCVQVWLDTSEKQNGTDVFEALATPSGATYGSWRHSAIAPEPKADGSPDVGHPFSSVPNWTPKGERVGTFKGRWENQPAWAVTMAIPLKSLPRPLQASPTPNSRFKINLLRMDFQTDGSTGQRVAVQSNFSPVYPNTQMYSPYRMAPLVLESTNAPALAMKN